MKPFFTFMIIACVMRLSFSVLAAHDEPLAAQSPSKESSPSADEKTDESVPREFLGFAEVSEFRGVIDDPDGYVNLRKEKRGDASVVTKVKAGEPFQFQKKEAEDWCRVKLKSGVSGWIHYSRIKLHFTENDLPGKSKNGDEIDEQAKEQGVNYYDVTQAAVRGDQQALKTFLALSADGAAAEEHDGVTCVVIHLIGDDAFAKCLRDQPRKFRDIVSFEGTDIVYPFDSKEYFRQHFSKSAKILFPDYNQLIRDYTNAIQLDPKDDRTYWERDCAQAEKDHYDAAIKDIEKAIEFNPKEVAYYLDLGTCQLYNRKPRKAIAASLKGLELSPDNAVLIKTNLAHGYLFDNQFEKAKAIYLENKDAKLRDEQQTFSEEVLDDFKQFRDAGITHPDMEKIEALLTSTTPDTNSTNPH
jgi:tetratricopeptide (TPR) repeat protein